MSAAAVDRQLAELLLELERETLKRELYLYCYVVEHRPEPSS